MPPLPEDDKSSLERARERLYTLDARSKVDRAPLASASGRDLPHAWEADPIARMMPKVGKRHVRIASLFFIGALVFFFIAALVAGYFLYYGGNSVSVNKIAITLQGPTTIAGGDIVPLSLAITNKNPVAIENATIEIDFPDSTRSADNVLTPYPRYTENLGTIASGATVTRSIKAVVFGGAGESLTLPVSLSYGISGSNSVFVKKSTYPLAITSTPLSISVESLSETVSGKPISFGLTVRNNATVALNNVVLATILPFGFSITSSSAPLTGSSFLIGTLSPGATKSVILSGVLVGQDNEQRVFKFNVGTADSASDSTVSVSYMTQEATVSIAAPFIDASFALNGSSADNAILAPGARQSASISYTNTLTTNVTNATVSVSIDGPAVDYNSIQSTNGFYNSATHSVVFSKDTDASLASLAPGASGIGSFTFATLPASAGVRSPTISFGISVSGTRVGQANVPENVSASLTRTAKVATAVVLSAAPLHSSGPFANTGPYPPVANQATTYAITWNLKNAGSAVAGGTVSATLPSYVTYTGKTSGVGAVTYDPTSRTVSWSVGDLLQGASAQAAFQVSLTPSSSQRGSTPLLVSQSSFSGYDRFAGTQISATADPVNTETKGDPGYSSSFSVVQ